MTSTARRSTADLRAASRRRRVRIGVGALGGLLVWALVGLPVFVFPSTGPLPAHADAVLVLGPITSERIAVAERLYRERRVDAMLWSTPTDHRRDTSGLTAACGHEPGLTCFRPDPSTTQGEARELAAQARTHGWTSVVVVTQSAHIVRARAIIGRCFAGRVTMASSGEPPQNGWAGEYVYQTLATVKLWLRSGC